VNAELLTIIPRGLFQNKSGSGCAFYASSVFGVRKIFASALLNLILIRVHLWLKNFRKLRRENVNGSFEVFCVALHAFLMKKLFSALTSTALLFALSSTARAWDYEGHRIVNQIAFASLPTNFPAIEINAENAERVAFLAGEPDRWRNTSDLPLKHCNGPDHFIDLDELPDYGLSATNLTPFRYEFAGQLALARAKNPQHFAPINPAKNEDKTRELVGFLPWAIEENYAKLKSAFSYLKTFEQFGSPEEIVNARQNAVYVMGIMGHFLGDAGQPLHTTKHFNGWVGENPRHFATNSTFHSWVDGGYIHKVGISFEEMKGRIRPAQVLAETKRASKEQGIFPVALNFINEQHKLVEPIYELNKNGGLSDYGQADSKGRAFITQQMLKSGQLLGDLWLSAWETAPIDTYLRGRLLDRTANATGVKPSKNSNPKSK
jgi:hypothetical protein